MLAETWSFKGLFDPDIDRELNSPYKIAIYRNYFTHRKTKNDFILEGLYKVIPDVLDAGFTTMVNVAMKVAGGKKQIKSLFKKKTNDNEPKKTGMREFKIG